MIPNGPRASFTGPCITGHRQPFSPRVRRVCVDFSFLRVVPLPVASNRRSPLMTVCAYEAGVSSRNRGLRADERARRGTRRETTRHPTKTAAARFVKSASPRVTKEETATAASAESFCSLLELSRPISRQSCVTTPRSLPPRRLLHSVQIASVTLRANSVLTFHLISRSLESHPSCSLLAKFGFVSKR